MRYFSFYLSLRIQQFSGDNHSPSSFLTTYFCTAEENELLFAQQQTSSSCRSCRGKHLSQQYQTLLLRPSVPKSCIDFDATELMLPRHPSCSCADKSRREPCPRARTTARWAELQSLRPLGWLWEQGFPVLPCAPFWSWDFLNKWLNT